MNTITLSQLKTKTTIGMHPWERAIKQTIMLDLSFQTDFMKTKDTDTLNDTVDYDLLSKTISDFIENSAFKLIETLATHIAELLINEFKISHFELTIYKPNAIKNANNVSVTITQ